MSSFDLELGLGTVRDVFKSDLQRFKQQARPLDQPDRAEAFASVAVGALFAAGGYLLIQDATAVLGTLVLGYSLVGRAAAALVGLLALRVALPHFLSGLKTLQKERAGAYDTEEEPEVSERVNRALVALLTGLLVVPTVLAGVGAVPAAGQSTSTSNYSVADLAERGQQIEGAAPSRRWLGERGSVYVAYQETNLVKGMASGSPKWAVDKIVSPDTPVDTTSVTMHFERPGSVGDKTVDVVVVAWKSDTRVVNASDGGVREERYLTAVDRRTTEVTLSQSFERVEVDLPDTEDPQRVTMFVEQYPNARWVFEHDPVALSDTVPFGSSWGSYLSWFFPRFLAVAAIGVPVAIGGAVKMLDVTHTGPGKGVMWWLLAGGLASYLALYFSHGSVTTLLTTAPWVMSLFVVFVAYVATLELTDPTEKGLLEGVATGRKPRPGLKQHEPNTVTVENIGLDGQKTHTGSASCIRNFRNRPRQRPLHHSV